MDSSAVEAGGRALFWSRTHASGRLINLSQIAEIDFRSSALVTTTSLGNVSIDHLRLQSATTCFP
jgi:hypothetical protein